MSMLKTMMPMLVQAIKPMILEKLEENNFVAINEDDFKKKVQELIPEVDLTIKDGKLVFFKVGVEIDF